MTEQRLAGGRTHMCGDLRASDTGLGVVLAGWVGRKRDHGGVVFLDLRDREGVVQVVAHPQDAPAAHAVASDVKPESVVKVTGKVRARPEGTVNHGIPTGEVEVAATAIEVITESTTPPFPIEDRVEVDELIRLRYRYLDLRRPEMTRILQLRHQLISSIRGFFDARGFVDVETPMLTKSTPEGARDFLVPSRLQRGKVYALPQSPQMFKQLLMVAGLDRYYQIVRCLRDEAPRADRSFEFTQLDVEMSFVEQEDVFAVIEPLYARFVQELHGVEVTTPFPRIPYDEMLARFGTDKPDLRYGMELADLSSVFAGTGFNAFASVLADEKGAIKGLAAPGGSQLSRKELDQLVQDAKGRGAAGLVWMVLGSDGVRSPVEKHLSEDEIDGVVKATDASEGDLVCIVADEVDRVHVALDGVRRHLAERLGLIPGGEWRYAWYTDPPLFDWSHEEGKWVSNHHPFTAPATDDVDPTTAKAKGYDLVLNGFEVGGGSIRIHRPDVQHRVFEVLGLSDGEIEEKFGHLLRAFRFGAPPHGGIAMGMDRIVMLMAEKEAIRDVTAFPKAQSGSDPLTGAPAPVDAAQLRELGLQVIARPTPKRDG